MITRFAPSPTGPLHLGHAYSALRAHDMARAVGGSFLLRIEDIDTTRSRQAWEAQILEDLTWLGVTWDAEPVRQSDHLSTYGTVLRSLWDRGLLYPCTCSRKDVMAALSAPQADTPLAYGPDGPVYPGTCRSRAKRSGPFPREAAIRLDMGLALETLGASDLSFWETGNPVMGNPARMTVSAREMLTSVGDIVLSRKEFLGSYHLSVVLDDADQEITHVVRGEDLFEATRIHVLLQRLLGLSTPFYHHHTLIRDDHGKRLAKRDDARAIAKYREDGLSPDDIRALING